MSETVFTYCPKRIQKLKKTGSVDLRLWKTTGTYDQITALRLHTFLFHYVQGYPPIITY